MIHWLFKHLSLNLDLQHQMAAANWGQLDRLGQHAVQFHEVGSVAVDPIRAVLVALGDLFGDDADRLLPSARALAVKLLYDTKEHAKEAKVKAIDVKIQRNVKIAAEKHRHISLCGYRLGILVGRLRAL